MKRGFGKLDWGKLAWLAVPLLASCSTHFPQQSRRSAPMVRQEVVRQEVALRTPAGPPASETVEIWVVADPLHTGLVLPLGWLEESGFRVPPSVRGERYVNMSWGDRVAYEQQRWLNAWEVFNALFLPSESVMEIIAFHYDPRQVFPQKRIYRQRVPRERGVELAAFLNRCGRFDEAGKWQVVGPPTWGKGNLLASPHSYGFPRLCNAFTAGALESCGYRFGLWSEIWADALLESCERQGFERLPELSQAEIDKIVAYTSSHPQ